MITGTHAILYSADADADRAFLRDVLGLSHVDAGGGWLIFKLPPAEVGVHPAETNGHELYLLCDGLDATMAELTAKGVSFAGGVTEAGWGRVTSIVLPGGGKVGLYEPRHPVAHDLPG
ncbi:MAG TPA: extradiol dioxygenase [Actinokineospora sp.]|nr:extradiol dioxygenase [Actinokineospora sp.]